MFKLHPATKKESKSDLQNWKKIKIDFKISSHTRGHLYSPSADHMSINNLPSAVGCLCVSTALALCALSVTETSYSSRHSDWGLFDSHVNPPHKSVSPGRREHEES